MHPLNSKADSWFFTAQECIVRWFDEREQFPIISLFMLKSRVGNAASRCDKIERDGTSSSSGQDLNCESNKGPDPSAWVADSFQASETYQAADAFTTKCIPGWGDTLRIDSLNLAWAVPESRMQLCDAVSGLTAATCAQCNVIGRQRG